jgi:hypothetical protein
MAMIGVHQTFKVWRNRDGEPKGERNQNDQGQHAPSFDSAFRGGSWNSLSRHLALYSFDASTDGCDYIEKNFLKVGNQRFIQGYTIPAACLEQSREAETRGPARSEREAGPTVLPLSG